MARGELVAILSVKDLSGFLAGLDKAGMGVQGVTTLIAEQGAVAEGTSGKLRGLYASEHIAGMGRLNTQLANTNGHLGRMRGHLSSILGMVGGGGFASALGILGSAKIFLDQTTYQQQLVGEAGLAKSRVGSVTALAQQQAGVGISTNDALQIARQVISANGVNTKNDEIQKYLTAAGNLQAISGGKVSALHATDVLVPAMQAVGPSFGFGNDPNKAMPWIMSMIQAGNMQTPDVAALFATGKLPSLAAFESGASGKQQQNDIAQMAAFVADTQGGAQVGPMARQVTTSMLHLVHPTAGGAKALDALGLDDIGKTLHDQGQRAAMTEIHDALAKKYGSATSAEANSAVSAIFGGSKGAAYALAVNQNYDLFQAKGDAVSQSNSPEAIKEALNSPQAKLLALEAKFKDLAGELGGAVLPPLMQIAGLIGDVASVAMPPLKVGFQAIGAVLSNPVTRTVLEGMLALKGLNFLAGTAGQLSSRIQNMSAPNLATYNPINRFQQSYAMGTYAQNIGAEASLRNYAATVETTNSSINSSNTQRSFNARETAQQTILADEEMAAASRTRTGSILADDERLILGNQQVAQSSRISMASMGGAMRSGSGNAIGALIGITSAIGAYQMGRNGDVAGGSLMGALGGAVAGFSVGGPWGAVVGGVAGGAASMIGWFSKSGDAVGKMTKKVDALADSMTGALATGTDLAQVLNTGLGTLQGKDKDNTISGLNALGFTTKQLAADAAAGTLSADLDKVNNSNLTKAQKNAVTTYIESIGPSLAEATASAQVTGDKGPAIKTRTQKDPPGGYDKFALWALSQKGWHIDGYHLNHGRVEDMFGHTNVGRAVYNEVDDGKRSYYPRTLGKGWGYDRTKDEWTYAAPRQLGGPVMPDQMYMTGEAGVELFRPSVPGTVINHQDTLKILRGENRGGGPQITFEAGSIQVMGSDGMNTSTLASEVADRVARELAKRASRL